MELGRDTARALIRDRRLSMGLGQRELAAVSGVSERSLRDIEAGRVKRPRATTLQRLARALSFSDDDLGALLATARPGSRTKDPLRIGVLGPLSVSRDDARIDITSTVRRSLLGLLAIQPGQCVSREEIVDVLWGDRPPKTWRRLLQGYVGSLCGLLASGRQGMPVPITSVSGGYTLDPEAAYLDLVRFDELLGQAQAARTGGRALPAWELFDAALRCWRGSVLADADSRLRHHPVAVALNRRRTAAGLAFADLGLASGRYEETCVRLRELVTAEPLHEGLHARLITAMAGCGEQAAALRLYAEVRAGLVDDLGVDPGPELAAAHLRVLRQETADRHVVPADTVPAQLPLSARGFAGRTGEIEQLDTFLAAAGVQPAALPILVVSGTAGVGKTTLAVHWAHRVRDRFPDGQLYLNLRGFDATAGPVEPAEAIRTFLDALHVPMQRIPQDVDAQIGLYRSLLAGRRMLLLLDNARDVEQVRPLLPGTAGCLVVVTSRDQLSGLVAVEGAHPLSLGLLPAAEGREFLARRIGAERVAAEPEAVDAIVADCARLPLALAIVATRAVTNPHFALTALAGELRHSRGDLDIFHGGDSATHVRAVFSWSYRTLGDEAARLFRLLSLHPGPDIGAPTAARLANVPEERVRRLLAELVRSHLVSEHEPGRYSFHDLLRVYAAERDRDEDCDEERAAAVQRLYDHYLHSTDAAVRMLYPQLILLPASAPPPGTPPAGFDAPERALAWLRAEHVNLVAAITYAAEHGPRPAAWLLAGLLRGYLARSRHSVQRLAVTGAGLDAARATGDLYGQASLHLGTAHAHYSMSRPLQAIAHLERTLDLSRRVDWAKGQIAALINLGAVYGELGRLDDASGRLLDALDVLRRTGSQQHSEIIVLNNLGNIERNRGRLREAIDYLTLAYGIWRESELPGGSYAALCTIGQVYHDLGMLSRSAEHLREAISLTRRIGDYLNEVDSLAALSRVRHDTGHFAEALELARTALRLSEDSSCESVARNALAAACHSLGHHDEAVEHYLRGLRLARKSGVGYLESEALIGLSRVYVLLGDDGEADASARAALHIARKATFRIREGQARAALAEIHLNRDEIEEAAAQARQAIDLHRQSGHRLGLADALAQLGSATCRSRGVEAALPFWREALALFTDIGSPGAGRVRALLKAASTKAV
ncbi:BTAD domain-containing putative transcriptional regulator [Streptosporangium sp. CA-115845]|uniref:BTAD domain-containing putative transcriptional regulator n=1 Tax=Streptosporangium sp. CA-115845 TaxID=3240071 RepID=UPI003D8E7BEA